MFMMHKKASRRGVEEPRPMGLKMVFTFIKGCKNNGNNNGDGQRSAKAKIFTVFTTENL